VEEGVDGVDWALAMPAAAPMLAIATTNNPTFRFNFMTAIPRSKVSKLLPIFAAARFLTGLRHGMYSARGDPRLTADAFAYKGFHSVARTLATLTLLTCGALEPTFRPWRRPVVSAAAAVTLTR
jgi:hypothetical protein